MYKTFVVYRYTATNAKGETIEADQFLNAIYESTGIGAPHRIREPKEEDCSNYILDPDEEVIDNERCCKLYIGHETLERTVTKRDKTTNKLVHDVIPTEELRYSTGVALLNANIIAFTDGSGDKLSSDSAIGRMRSILKYNIDMEFDYEKTASSDDLVGALGRLSISEFKFEARPFNPHPKMPGTILHNLMKNAKIAKISAKAVPYASSSLSNKEDGLLNEVVGLKNEHYADFGLKGTTSSGASVEYKKTGISGDKEKDQKSLDKHRNIKITVQSNDDGVSLEEHIVRAIKEIFDV